MGTMRHPTEPAPRDSATDRSTAAVSRRRLRRFRTAYAEHRAAQGYGAGGTAELLALPYPRRGPHTQHWAVRACTYERFVSTVLRARAREVAPRPVHVLDLGAGNGWLCYRVRRHGQRAVAVDIRDDAVDGLGAAAGYDAHLASMFGRVAASFEALPLAADAFDIAVFNAALHYALDLETALSEAARTVMPGGRIAVLDSPVCRSADEGRAMIEEKRRRVAATFGERADDLTGLPFVGYLTRARLKHASAELGLQWRRHRVWYPIRYELRPIAARLRGERPPARFDLWEAEVPRETR